ncbi:MAG TPA: NAD-binding protein [Acidimicrobiia bacterium]|jgi:voltage-gated potassium channel
MLLRFRSLFDSPFLRRVSWHVKRVGEKIDRRFFTSLILGLVLFLASAAVVIWLAETDRSMGQLGQSFYWAGATVLGLGEGGFVTGPIGWIVGWILGLFGVAIVATLTGALVGFVIDFLLKEGQGMGAAGYRDHIVVCGWNSTARDLIGELAKDEYGTKIVLLHDSERNPTDDVAYFVRGDTTTESDLKRAGIENAVSAIICPRDGSNEADMSSILTVLAIESLAPQVRTVVEVNNPDHVAHFRRANVDEVMVTSKLAAHLLARTAMYPGLSSLVSDIVAGGEGSELYRVILPDDCVGMTIDELAAKLRRDHQATLLAITRQGITHTNPGFDFTLSLDDDLVVVAESLGALRPLREASALP